VFRQFDGYLARQAYIAHGGQILDASIVPVPKNHNTREENKAIKTGEVPEGWADRPAKRSQKDTDARWTKKHGKSHYGCKNHVNVDRQHKLVRRYHVSDAAPHDSQAADHLLMQGKTGSEVWADPAYRSEEMGAKLRARVEHVFGTQITEMGGTLVRTVGLIRAKAKIGMKNLAYNMRRLAQLCHRYPCPV